MQNLKDVRKWLSSLPDWDSGGCGVVAFAIYLWMKNQGKDMSTFKIIYKHRSSDGYDYRNNKKYMEGDIDTTLESCYHVLIEYKGKVFDARDEGKDCLGFHFYDEVVINSDMVEKFMRKSLNEGCWNQRFQRDKYLPKIEKRLKINFSL